MPKQRTITVYSFSELTGKAKERAAEKLRMWNNEYGWWESTYEDAENIGLKITNFDIYLGTIGGLRILPVADIIEQVLNQHGETTETYKTATKYKEQMQAAIQRDVDLEDEFIKALSQDYLVMLREEYEYRCSDEALQEMAEANGYEFDENGRVI